MSVRLKKGSPALFLAPMEGIADYPMRTFMTELPGFTHTVTEFLRISQLVLPARCYPRHALELRSGSRTATGVPVILQFLGGHPSRIAESAALAVKSGAIAIDLNFGCPAPTVNRHDGGASLLKDTCRLGEIVREVRQAVPKEIPVSAKLRLGWDDPRAIYANAEAAAKGGADWITIHGRTKMQGYTPPAYWGPIGEIRRMLDIPVVANGEIWTIADFERCREETGCDHFMIGRGALANPHLAAGISFKLGLLGTELPPNPEPEEWRNYFRRFVELALPVSKNPSYAVKRLKQWLRFVAARNHFPDFDRVKVLNEPHEIAACLEAMTPPSV